MEAAALTRPRLIRRGVSLEVFTLAWMTVEAAVAVGAGIAAGSVALVAFGIDSVIEFVAAFVVLREFRAEQMGRARPAGERGALRVIAVTFFLLAAYIAIDGIYTLASASRPEQSVAGIAVAGAALLVMPTLALFKRRIGERLESEALVADAAESAFCAYLSAVVLVGVALNTFGWWWADPVAALLIIPLVAKEGLEALGEG